MTAKKTNSIMLTKKERLLVFSTYYSCQAVDITKMSHNEYLCRAQAKKLKGEMEKPCPHQGGDLIIPKRRCLVCWQGAFKEVE